ncbi:MAG: hypothetical protein ACXW03_01645 [Methylobacter sp.]
MKIYYFVNIRGRKVGSVNAYKIEQMGSREMGKGTQVLSCDIADFDGVLHNAEWLG